MLRLIGLLFALVLAPAAWACGPDSDCVIGDRSYRIALPEGPGPFGAIVYMHGYRGSAAGVMRNGGLRAMARRLGVALIAAAAKDGDWQIRNAPRKGLATDERELAYFDALLEDVTRRFPVDPERILAAGFSAGGMMTWTLACRRGDRFAAFAAVAGTFWAPIPERCPNPPVNLVHINGRADRVVPVEGRPIADTRQGNSRLAMEMFARDGGYVVTAGRAEDAAPEELGLECDVSVAPGGQRLLFCLHDGGHVVRPEWIAWAYRMFVSGP